MLNLTCAHCGTSIVDQTSAVSEDGKTYCCANCLLASTRRVHPATPGMPKCAHCQTLLVDTSTRIDREGETFCCQNCAIAASRRRLLPP